MSVLSSRGGLAVLSCLFYSNTVIADRISDLRMEPGMELAWGIANSKNTEGKAMGDYDFYVNVVSANGSGFSFDWIITLPDWKKGNRTILDTDARLSRSFTNWFGAGLVGTTSPCTSLLFSQRTFRELRAGSVVDSSCPSENPEWPKYSSLENIGTAAFAISLDGEEAILPVIKLRNGGFGGGEVWVLDNPKFPLLVKQSDGYVSMSLISIYRVDKTKILLDELAKTRQATTNQIYFLSDSDDLTPVSLPALDAIAGFLRVNTDEQLVIEGHTDNIGGDQHNRGLSERRASSVKAYLVTKHGIASERLNPIGLGLEQPVADNGTPEGRARNRRVVFRLTAGDGDRQ
jgi:outer membrane protein OmpA-like peptidoglycan-associated protein